MNPFRVMFLFAPLFLIAWTVRAETNPTMERPQGLGLVMAFYPDLDSADPRSLAFKVRSLIRDEYSYFRGMAPSFYQAASAPAAEWMAQESNHVLLHGDIHIGNIGTYQGPGHAGKDIHFGVVDLDEVIEGPFQLDLLRAMTAIRFGWQSDSGEVPWQQTARELCAGYEATLSGATNSDSVLQHPAVKGLLSKAARNQARPYVARYMEEGAPPRFRSARIKGGLAKDLLDPLLQDERDAVQTALWNYLQNGCDSKTREEFRFASEPELRDSVVDIVRWTRVESSGSQGVHKYLVLLRRPLKTEEGDLILELKEEPIPSAARAGLIQATAGTARAEQVANAGRLMLNPAPRLVGFTSIGERGFLVRTKDPWAEELEPTDFGRPGKESALMAARLMGEVLGIAHRNVLINRNQPQRIESIRAQSRELPTQLSQLSETVEKRLRKEYTALKADPAARALVDRAEMIIQSVKP